MMTSALTSPGVTFNYDDVLDQSLLEVYRYTGGPPRMDYWHPDGGYGFYCRPSRVCVTDRAMFMDQPSTRVVATRCSVRFEWDEAKRRANLRKHGVDFAGAASVFEGLTVTVADTRYDYEEDRFISFGILDGHVVAVAHAKATK